LLLRTPVSARSYRASVFLLDYVLCCHCQANKLIHSFIILRHYEVVKHQCNIQ